MTRSARKRWGGDGTSAASAVCLLGSLVFSACSSGAPATLFTVGEIHVDERFGYRGSDNSTLWVTVEAPSTRVDALMREHETQVLNITFQPADRTGIPMALEESVDRSRGLVVQQVGLCALFGRRADGQVVCSDEHRALVELGAGGLPGAFGIGPFWGKSLTEGRVEVELESFEYSLPSVAYQAAGAYRAGEACLELTAATTADFPSRSRALPFTVVFGPFLVCHGFGMPVHFVTSQALPQILGPERFVAFELFAYEGTSNPAETAMDSNADGWSRPTKGLRLSAWRPPYYTDETNDTTPFPVAEAHNAALTLDADYRRLFEPGASGVVFHTFVLRRGFVEFQQGLASESTFERSLVASGQGADALRVVVEKKIITSSGVNRSEFRVADKGTDSSAVVPDPVVQQGRLGEAIARTVALSRLNYSFQPAGYTFVTPARPWHQDPAPRLAGYEIVVYFDRPKVSGISAPFFAAFDGPSGALWRIEVEPARLPLSMPAAWVE